MKIEFRISKSDTTYYVRMVYNCRPLSLDKKIVNALDLEVKEYHVVMQNNFNAYIKNNRTYFKNEEDCKRAIEEYLEPRLMILILSEKVFPSIL